MRKFRLRPNLCCGENIPELLIVRRVFVSGWRMPKSRVIVPSSGRAGLQLSRRSIVAAGAILITAGSAATSEALAFAKPKPPRFHGRRDGSDYVQSRDNNDHPGSSDCVGCNCFLLGTRLLTPASEIPIEHLKIGDAVVTLDGQTRNIRWIARVAFERECGTPWSTEVQPVRVSKDALASGSPSRDLYISLWHMLYLNGTLLPVSNLINGQTIAAVDPPTNRLEYFHVELDRHEVLLADSAPCESLLASAESRRQFDNYDEYVARFGHVAPPPMAPCAPIAFFNGGRSELRSRLRSALAPVFDIRHPLDIARDDLEARALQLWAA